MWFNIITWTQQFSAFGSDSRTNKNRQLCCSCVKRFFHSWETFPHLFVHSNPFNWVLSAVFSKNLCKKCREFFIMLMQTYLLNKKKQKCFNKINLVPSCSWISFSKSGDFHQVAVLSCCASTVHVWTRVTCAGVN